MKSFGPKKFEIPCTDQKVPFWQFFRQGQDGHALLVWPLRIPHRISKIIFVLGSYELLVMLICQNNWKITAKLCGLLRKAELYLYHVYCSVLSFNFGAFAV